MSDTDEIEGPIIIYDSNCMLCSKAIGFILRHESSDHLKFTSLETAIRQSLISSEEPRPLSDSIFLYDKDKLQKESQAVFAILKYLSTPYRILRYLSVMPTFLTDGVYRFIARNRYKWFGERTASCLILSSEQEKRFLG